MIAPILIVSPDDAATCPHCAARLDTPLQDGSFVEVDCDIDGPIHEGICASHGAIRWQVDNEPNDNEFRR